MRTIDRLSPIIMAMVWLASVPVVGNSGAIASEQDAPTNVITVTNPLDNVDNPRIGSLRWAIQQANLTPALDEIRFNIAFGGVTTIRLNAALPDITYPVIIDGTTQPGFSGSPLIELDGTNAGYACGLRLLASGCTVRGLVIENFDNAGIESDSGYNYVVG